MNREDKFQGPSDAIRAKRHQGQLFQKLGAKPWRDQRAWPNQEIESPEYIQGLCPGVRVRPGRHTEGNFLVGLASGSARQSPGSLGGASRGAHQG